MNRKTLLFMFFTVLLHLTALVVGYVTGLMINSLAVKVVLNSGVNRVVYVGMIIILNILSHVIVGFVLPKLLRRLGISV